MINLIESYRKGEITQKDFEDKLILEGFEGNLLEKINLLNDAETINLKFITKNLDQNTNPSLIDGFNNWNIFFKSEQWNASI